MAAGTVTNHTNIERIQDTKYLFTDAASLRQVVADNGHQRQIFFHFNPSQGREFRQ